MKINLITVTYGDRIELLKKLLKSINEEGKLLHKIIIIHNQSARELNVDEMNEYKNLEIEQINNKENLGSSLGYKIGLQRSIYYKADYTYLIDDDNEIENNALINIIKEINKDKKIILCSMRKTREKYLDLYNGINKNVIRKSNKFMNYGLDYLVNNDEIKRSTTIQYLPYSGLLIPTSIINIIGYPDPKFFLYQDDRDYTYRMFLAGFNFQIVPISIIFDNDDSWVNANVNKIEKIMPSILRESVSNIKVYNAVKSRMFFELKHQVTVRNLYIFNSLVCLVGISIVCIFFPRSTGGYKRLRLISKAIFDAFRL
jgi:GT2 family glycosyltransferase